MGNGAHSPEELETMFEDAFLTRDRQALAELFEDEAVLAAGNGAKPLRGHEIGYAATAFAHDEGTYVAEPQTILQARDTALVVGKRSVTVARRRTDGTWRYAIALLSLEGDSTKEEGNDAGHV